MVAGEEPRSGACAEALTAQRHVDPRGEAGGPEDLEGAGRGGARGPQVKGPRARPLVDDHDPDRAVWRPGRKCVELPAAGGRDSEQPRSGGRGLGEHVEAVVLGHDDSAPLPADLGEPEQRVGRARERVEVDAVDADARQLEQGVEGPQGRGERSADGRVPPARDRVDLVDPDRGVVRVRLADRRDHTAGQRARGLRREHVRDRRVARVRRLDVAALERVAVDRRDRDLRVVGQERPDLREPAGAPIGRPGQRQVRQRAADAGEVLGECFEVVSLRTAGGARQSPVERAVQLGLVAELERRDPAPTDPVELGVRLGAGDLRAVRLEVDSQRQLRAELGGERVGDVEPVASQRGRDAGRGRHAGDRPPGPVGRVSADPELRRLARREVADQLDEHGIDGGGVGAGIGLDREVLEREAEEAGRDRPGRGRRSDRDEVGGACGGVRRGRGRDRREDARDRGGREK